MRKKMKLALGLLAVIATPCMAETQERGFYLGGSIGQARVKAWCDTSDAPPGFALSSCDDKATSWKLFGGYRFNRHFAAEATYLDFGKLSATVAFGGLTSNVSSTAKAWGLAALGMLPVGERFEVFGKLGFVRGESESRVSIGGTSGTLGETGTEAHFGAGLLYNFTRNWGVRGEWERIEKSKIDVFSLGAQYKF
jgi:OOP family OmpA-OmpF porin